MAAAFATGVFASVAWTRSQPTPPLPRGHIVTADDLGFRIEGYRDGKPMGRLMVRINGEWLEAGAAITVHPATGR